MSTPVAASIDGQGASSHTVVLNISGLSMTFPGLKALDEVALQVAAGEVLAVVGQNGSGKSTLVKVLAGINVADNGATIEHRDIRFIHQDLGLVANLSTVENLDVGNHLGVRSLLPIHRRVDREAARRSIARFGGDFDVDRPVGELAAAERTVVAIARAMSDWDAAGGVLVLDEPTAALGGAEVERLFEAIRRVAVEGAGVVFISHRLDEVLGLSDRVLALRNGRVVADVKAADIDHRWLVDVIAGRTLAEVKVGHHSTESGLAVKVSGLVAGTLQELNLELRKGEILGLSGLVGSGREDAAAAIFGAIPRIAGTVAVDGNYVSPGRPSASIKAALAFVPADRLRHGAVMTLKARENLTLPKLTPLRRAFGRLDRSAERLEAADWASRVELHPPDPERVLTLFSGGNQQKVVLAKWLRITPQVLLVDEPTQGVDVGAKAALYSLVDRAAAEGAGVLVSSSDVNELMTLCDRILVIRHGVVAAELGRHEFTEARLVAENLGLATTVAPGPQPAIVPTREPMTR